MSFLKAEWRNLALANYEIDPKLLQKYLPYGTELDLWNGKCMVSLVGFMFINTAVLGLKIPGHINFEEVNLRFYVKRTENDQIKRGVVFIKEIVPKKAITFIANSLYKENYETMKMDHRWKTNENALNIQYRWKKNNIWHHIQILANTQSNDIIPESETEFITEHYWGYAKINANKSNEYEVTHPKWKVFKVTDFDINVDFGALYGVEFNCLNLAQPKSVMLAEGSKITVENKKVIKL
ncbi:MAG: YqjF family protein [Flavobacteriales bacterium]